MAAVTGAMTHLLQKENKRRRHAQQRAQQEQNYWMHHGGCADLPHQLPNPPMFHNNMCPRNLALHHPAAPLLVQYATCGCPVETGDPWSSAQMQWAIERGPHASALLPAAIAQMDIEVAEKVRAGQARLVKWNDIKHAPPRQLKSLRWRWYLTSLAHSAQYWTFRIPSSSVPQTSSHQ